MKLRRLFELLKLLTLSIVSSFDRQDIPIVTLILGLSLVGYGASQIRPGIGPIIVGVLMVLYAKPLSRWVK